MNQKLKAALRDSTNEQGFALPLAVGMGMIMILVSTTMIMRSHDNQMTASAQKATVDSLSVAETGITRVQALLKQYPLLAAKNATNWNTTTDTARSTCLNSAIQTGSNETEEERILITRSNLAQWIDINSGNPDVGEFRVVSYLPNTPTADLATLNVEGRAKSESVAATTAASNSTSAVSVQIPLEQSLVPGTWVRLNTGAGDPIDVVTNNSINANVRVEGCSFDSNKISNAKLEKVNSNGMEAVKPIYDGSTPSVSSNPNPLPPLPALPDSYYSLPPINASNCYMVLPRIERASGLKGTTCGSPLSNRTNFGTPSAPRKTDVATGGVYSYLIRSTSSNSPGGDSISLSSSALIINPPAGTKVVLYVRGNITISGTSTGSDGSGTVSGAPSRSCDGISTPVTSYINGGSPSNLEIYGADGTGLYDTGYRMETISVSDTTMINALIYAPEAIVNVSQGQVRGSVWSRIFKSSNSSGCRVGMVQQDVKGIGLRVIFPSAIGVIRSWLRREAQ